MGDQTKITAELAAGRAGTPPLATARKTRQRFFLVYRTMRRL
jgi:hypothetical protein